MWHLKHFHAELLEVLMMMELMYLHDCWVVLVVPTWSNALLASHFG